MRILHISNSDDGGAGLCCVRIHQSLLDMEVDSKVLVFHKTTDAHEVYGFGHKFGFFLYRIGSRLLDMIGIRLTARSKMIQMSRQGKAVYTAPVSPFDVTTHQLLEWADIIHLHWINGFVDYPSFFEKVQKPVIWTLHDENLFYGCAHFKKNLLTSHKYEMKYRRIKRAAVGDAHNLSIVFLSEMMRRTFGEELFIKDKRQVVINNSIEVNAYSIYEKNKMRKKYNIDKDKTVLVFMAYDIMNEGKGLRMLVDVLTKRSDSNRFVVLAIGGNPSNQPLPGMIKAVGLVKDHLTRNELMCCGDFFVMPSIQEAFAQSPMEAMACGLPVLAFPVSGTEELINDENGVICKEMTPQALNEGIDHILKQNYRIEKIREYIMEYFSSSVMAGKYTSLYRTALTVGNMSSVEKAVRGG